MTKNVESTTVSLLLKGRSEKTAFSLHSKIFFFVSARKKYITILFCIENTISDLTIYVRWYKHTCSVWYPDPEMCLWDRSQWDRSVSHCWSFLFPKDRLFPLDQWFQSGDYHFVTRGIIINNCDYCLRHLHAYRIKDSKTQNPIPSVWFHIILW